MAGDSTAAVRFLEYIVEEYTNMVATRQVGVMSANGVVNPVMIEVTPEMAEQWLADMAYVHQRTIRAAHVAFLAEEMRRGNFTAGTQIHIVSLHGRLTLVDGYHRLKAVIASGVPHSFSRLITFVDSEERIAWVYGNIDVGLKRTGSDFFGALELHTRLGLTESEVRTYNGTINYMDTGCLYNPGESARLHKDDAVGRMELYAPFARDYFSLLKGCDQRIYRAAIRAGTLSVALLSLRYSLPRAENRGDPSVIDFWRGVIFDDGIQVGDPRKVANRHLLTTIMRHGNVQLITSAPYSTRYLINCFHAHMTRRTINHTVVRDAKCAIDMYGVPGDRTLWWQE